MKEKHDQIMEWIDLPLEERPQLIAGRYTCFKCISASQTFLSSVISQRTNPRSTKPGTEQARSRRSLMYVRNIHSRDSIEKKLNESSVTPLSESLT